MGPKLYLFPHCLSDESINSFFFYFANLCFNMLTNFSSFFVIFCSQRKQCTETLTSMAISSRCPPKEISSSWFCNISFHHSPNKCYYPELAIYFMPSRSASNKQPVIYSVWNYEPFSEINSWGTTANMKSDLFACMVRRYLLKFCSCEIKSNGQLRPLLAYCNSYDAHKNSKTCAQTYQGCWLGWVLTHNVTQTSCSA